MDHKDPITLPITPTIDLDALRRRTRVHAEEEARSSTRKVLLGIELRGIRDDQLYRHWGYDRFEDYTGSELKLGTRAVNRYISGGRLPLYLIEGTDFAGHELDAIQAQDQRLWEVLVEAAKAGATHKQLRAGGQAGKALLRPRKKQAPDVEVACRAAYDAAMKPAPEGKRGKDLADLAPSDLARRAVSLLGRLLLVLVVLCKKPRPEPGQEGKWLTTLHEGVRKAVLIYARWYGEDPAVLFAERRQAERGEGPEEVAPPRGASGEKPNKDEKMAPADRSPEPAQPPTQSGAVDEPWHMPLVRAVLGLLGEEERAVLAEHLYAAVRGLPVGPLAAFLRPLQDRLPPDLAELLDDWLAAAGDRALTRRWIYLFSFFVGAALPGFRKQLHSLLALDLPEELMPTLWEMCECYPRYEDLPRPSLRPGAGEWEAAEAELLWLMPQAERLWAEIIESGAAINHQAQWWLFGEAFDMVQDFKELERLIQEVASRPKVDWEWA